MRKLKALFPSLAAFLAVACFALLSPPMASANQGDNAQFNGHKHRFHVRGGNDREIKRNVNHQFFKGQKVFRFDSFGSEDLHCV